jgi:hypothetical protein
MKVQTLSASGPAPSSAIPLSQFSPRARAVTGGRFERLWPAPRGTGATLFTLIHNSADGGRS